MSYYPEYRLTDRNIHFYVEFGRGNVEGEFTLFLRQWIRSEEEMEKLKEKCPKDFSFLLISNEGHPWNIFTARYGRDGSMPDKKWVCWMVDALNEKINNDSNKKGIS